MNFVDLIIQNKLLEAKHLINEKLNVLVLETLKEAKLYVTEDLYENVELDEATYRKNPNIIRMGRISKVRRRLRRNKQGRIVLQKNRRRSTVKGYKIKGNRLMRIPTITRLKKARKLKLSWKTSRKAKLRRSLLKRKMTMRRRQSMGLR